MMRGTQGQIHNPPDSITDSEGWRGEVGKIGKGMVCAWVRACVPVCLSRRQRSKSASVLLNPSCTLEIPRELSDDADT